MGLVGLGLLVLTIPAVASERAAGLLYAPGGAEEGSGWGAEFYRIDEDGALRGGAVWFAGTLAPEPDVDTTIPHWDYYTETYDSRWGLLYLWGRDNGRVALISGIGVAIVETVYIDHSNVTGWTWDGGWETSIEPQAQIGMLFHAGQNAALRVGYDSQFGAFAGFACKF